ncbi:MAG: BMP family ABC transporter substrate-binding protein [Clostridiales bacterium]|nr:BMP family ABC transporter substrate-binding protein [Clostridiales bacterium]
MVNLKRILACIICVFLLLNTGCKKNDPDVPTGIQQNIKKLALITSDIEIELDYNYAAIWEGVLSCCQTNNINYSFYMPDDMSEQALSQQFEYAVGDGASTIMCMGDEFAPVIKVMQDKYPDVNFVAIDVPADSIGELKKNTHCVMFRQEQGGYIVGYASVKDGFTKLAYMGDHKSATYEAYVNGFIKGINDAAVQSNIPVSIEIAYISDFDSPDFAFDHVGSWFSGGTELLMICADDYFTESCAQHAVNNMGYMIGTDNDKSHLGANLDYNPFITSAQKGLREVVDTTLEMVISGQWDDSLGGKTLYYGLQNGNYIYLPDHEATWLFSGFSLEDYQTLKNSIATGSTLIDGSKMPTVNEDLVKINIKTAED